MPDDATERLDATIAHLRNTLNGMLARPGMYVPGPNGAQAGTWLLAHTLAIAEGRPDAWKHQEESLQERGAWTPTGLVGAFRNALGIDDQQPIASTLAICAHRLGWLDVARPLSPDEYASVRAAVPEFAERDTTCGDVTSRFGSPSVQTALGRWSHVSLLYLSEATSGPAITFHFEPSPWAPGVDLDAHKLLAVHVDEGSFLDGFTHTPHGRTVRAADIADRQEQARAAVRERPRKRENEEGKP